MTVTAVDLVDDDDDGEVEHAEGGQWDATGDDCARQHEVLQHDGASAAGVVERLRQVRGGADGSGRGQRAGLKEQSQLDRPLAGCAALSRRSARAARHRHSRVGAGARPSGAGQTLQNRLAVSHGTRRSLVSAVPARRLTPVHKASKREDGRPGRVRSPLGLASARSPRHQWLSARPGRGLSDRVAATRPTSRSQQRC